MNREISTIATPVIGFAFTSPASAKEIMPMFGGAPIDGYALGKDIGPKGTLSYNPQISEFKDILEKRYSSNSNAAQNTAISDVPTIQQN